MKRSPEILDRGTKYTVPNAFNKPRSHFYATNSMLNYEYGGPLMNSVKHIFGEGGFKPMAKNIPSPYKFEGTKIYRDTTEIPNFRQGGAIEKPWLNNLYPNGGQLYTYADRPEAVYQKDNNGNWLIKLPSTNGQFVPLNDPTGKRAGELNEKAVLMPSQFRRQYDALNDTQPQLADNLALPNINKPITNEIERQQQVRNTTVNTVLRDPELSPQQKQALFRNEYMLDQQAANYAAQAAHGDNITQGQEYTWQDKLGNIVRNPLVAAAYAMQPGEFNMPMNYSAYERSPDYNDPVWNNNAFLQGINVARYFHPLGMAMGAVDAGLYFNKDLDKAIASGETKDWKQAGLSAAETALNLIPSARYIGRSGRMLTGAENATLNTMRASNNLGLPPSVNNFLGNRVYPSLSSGNATSVGNTAVGQLIPRLNPTNINYNPLLRNTFNTAVSAGKINNTAEAINAAQDLAPFTNSNAANTSKLSNVKSFAEELTGSIVNRNRAKSLREAEDWMTSWMQHPVTQQKIQNSYQQGLNRISEFKLDPVTNEFVPVTVGEMPREAHNLAEGIKFSSGYNATGRLQEYPLRKQAAELLQVNTPGIHTGNWGVSYTHGTKPGEWLADPSYNFGPELTTNMVESKTVPKELMFPRHGNWISRTLTPEQRVSTGIHELTHDAIKSPTLRDTDLRNTLSAGVDSGELRFYINKHKDNPEVLRHIGYLTDPTEIHARVMELRHHYGLTPDTVVTPKFAGKMMKDVSKNETPIDNQFAKLFSDNDRTAKMFNKAWMAPAAIAGGTAASLMYNPWEQKPQGLRQGGKFQTSYFSSDVKDNYYKNGGMIKRADGSYSRRGLWDNIRANAGSGKEPTKEMLAQERKINREYEMGGSLPKPYSLPEDSFKQGGRGLHNSIYASTPGQYPQPYRNGGSLVANSSMPTVEPVRSNLIPASAFEAPVQFYPEVYTDIEKSDGTSYKQSIDGKWYISGPRAKNFTLMHDPAGIWADSLQEGIRQAKVVPSSQIPIQDNSSKV